MRLIDFRASQRIPKKIEIFFRDHGADGCHMYKQMTLLAVECCDASDGMLDRYR